MFKYLLPKFLVLSMIALAYGGGGVDDHKKGGCVIKVLPTSNEDPAQAEFQSLMESFFAAIKGRDFDTFSKFFRDDVPFQAFLPGGKTIGSAAEFLTQQRETWFAGTTGSFEYQVLEAGFVGELGVTRIQVIYKNNDPAGKPFELEIYISSLFRNVDGRWYNIHVQNTVMKDIR